ncbi:DUF2971 domain-containing protein [Celerinatantimonas sp. YJH-8]|uniref:DUF2971 domain-containing protein n=1 Tax=Celerinatantimonas sp. YJH-8 TaxID=3228714 RepID=UPI0038C9DBA0
MMLKEITQRLFNQPPQITLYHYTTLSGLLGIVRSRVLWASDVRYMNDAAELHHALGLLKAAINERISKGSPHTAQLEHFAHWLKHQLNQGHMLFVASFRANGNLLSQWRGYSTIGKGVSLGFDPHLIANWANEQHFQIGQCIYQSEQQHQLIEQVLDAICQLDSSDPNPFRDIETDLLRLAVLLKHPSFREEEEWRVILPLPHHHQPRRIKFREGNAMLKPYTEFCLYSHSEAMALEHVFLGPTPDSELSMNSLRLFLEQHQLTPRQGIDDSQIPYRAC